MSGSASVLRLRYIVPSAKTSLASKPGKRKTRWYWPGDAHVMAKTPSTVLFPSRSETLASRKKGAPPKAWRSTSPAALDRTAAPSGAGGSSAISRTDVVNRRIALKEKAAKRNALDIRTKHSTLVQRAILSRGRGYVQKNWTSDLGPQTRNLPSMPPGSRGPR